MSHSYHCVLAAISRLEIFSNKQRLSQHCRNYLDANKLVIVCSARSGSTKALGTTNLLLKASSEALQRTTKKSNKSTNGRATSGTGTGTVSPGTGANTPIHYRGLFGRTYGGESDGSQSPPTSAPRSRSSSSSSPGAGKGLFGFTPINGKSGAKDVPAFHATVDLIKEEHYKAARESIEDPEILAELEEEIDTDCEWLRSFLYAAKVCAVL